MADIFTPTPEQVATHAKWVATRPPEIKALADKFLPWKLYRLHDDDGKPTQRVTVVGFSEKGAHHRCEHGDGEGHCIDQTAPTVRVAVLGKFNIVGFERQVMGIPPERLVECDLPGPEEVVGSADLTTEEIALPAAMRLVLMHKRGPTFLRKFQDTAPLAYGPPPK